MKYLASLIIGGVWYSTYFLVSHGIPAVPALVVISLVAVAAMRKVMTKQTKAKENGLAR